MIIIGPNGAAFLGKCLASVFAQTVTPDEILYVDDASTEDSLTVARTFANRGLQILALPENVGMNAGRMAGFDRSAAPFLLFVDGDNVLPPDDLATLAAELAARPEAAFTCPGKRFLGDPDAVAWRKKWHPDGTWTPSRPNRRQRSLGANAPNFRNKESGRGGQIRTDDFLLPKQALYQAELRPATRPARSTNRGEESRFSCMACGHSRSRGSAGGRRREIHRQTSGGAARFRA